jgi:DHA1 family bicyclomycin/chloramphenicol resistance-like MFS transporter
MEPLGHIAGVGAAVIGSLSSLISVTVGSQIARSYDGTAMPVALGYVICGLCALAALYWAAQGRERKVR